MKACSGGGGDCVVVGCGDGEWWVMGVAASNEERERERESMCNRKGEGEKWIKKWIVFRYDVKNRIFDVGWIIKWVWVTKI